MKVEIDADTVLYMAELAAVELTADEVERMRRDLGAILGYVETLDEVDTSDVPPTTHVLDIETPLRPDEVRNVLSAEDVVRNAPDHTENTMVVPKVLD